MALPSGFRFRPNDDDLIGYYLRKKLLGGKLSPEPIRDVDLYSDHPKNLTAPFAPANLAFEWFFFTPTNRKHEGGKQVSREAGPGRWKSTQTKSYMKVNGFRGTKQSFSYMEKTKGKKENSTDWLMDEYTIESSSQPIKHPEKLHEWVLCKVHLTPRARARKETELLYKGKAAMVEDPSPSSSNNISASSGASTSQCCLLQPEEAPIKVPTPTIPRRYAAPDEVSGKRVYSDLLTRDDDGCDGTWLVAEALSIHDDDDEHASRQYMQAEGETSSSVAESSFNELLVNMPSLSNSSEHSSGD